MIPKRCLTSLYGLAKGVQGLYDFYMVRHVTGGLSMLKFRYYAQGREAWQGPPVHYVWFDEEPPEDIYEEGLARTIATGGSTLLTFTPKLGWTPVVNLYLKDPDPEYSGRACVRMTLYDALHKTKEEVEAEIRRWPKHQQPAVIYGDPAMGVGQIYPYPEEDLIVDPFEIPEHWPVIFGIDVAGSSGHPGAHPTAAVKLYWDRDNDCVYLVREYRRQGLKPAEHWLTLRRWGDGKWAWPKDALQVKGGERGTGEQLIHMYRTEGMSALPIHAQYPKPNRKKRGKVSGANLSTVSIERGIMDLQTRMSTDGFKVFSNCKMFFEEMRQYHRNREGTIVRENDDILDAVRYALMMLRFADVPSPRGYRRRRQINSTLGF